jgi:glycosyltransferase involved in cell wall biosynthesis
MEPLKFSVVTVSFNQAEFIEHNIQSVLRQDYANYEHIIIDGGSLDNTIKTLSKYDHLNWISEPDKGQSDGLNKGFKKANGDIICWLNSDDELANGAFHSVSKYFLENSEELAVTGSRINIDYKGSELNITPSREYTFDGLLNKNKDISQPATFFKRTVFDKIGYLRKDLHYAMDYEFFLRLASLQTIKAIPEVLAKFRRHDSSKTNACGLKLLREQRKLRREFNGKTWSPAGKILLWYTFKLHVRKMLLGR